MYYILTDYSDQYYTADTYESAEATLEDLISSDSEDKEASVTGYIFLKPEAKASSVFEKIKIVYEVNNEQ